ncbi:hypothetical protein GCM10022423_15520 [Flavobacterium ginsengiterrae]|uniref:Uncharacterized protein n=1 Tax=Flavobacterium ginsengiterrae TaxID=871695 RepID=A0ABP7GFD7_9FLAO
MIVFSFDMFLADCKVHLQLTIKFIINFKILKVKYINPKMLSTKPDFCKTVGIWKGLN